MRPSPRPPRRAENSSPPAREGHYIGRGGAFALPRVGRMVLMAPTPGGRVRCRSCGARVRHEPEAVARHAAAEVARRGERALEERLVSLARLRTSRRRKRHAQFLWAIGEARR